MGKIFTAEKGEWVNFKQNCITKSLKDKILKKYNDIVMPLFIVGLGKGF